MKIRLYLDEDAMDSDLVHALRIHGVDVTTALDEGMIQHHDNGHLAFAASQGRRCIPSTRVIILHCTANTSCKADIIQASFLPSSNDTVLASRCAACLGSSILDQPK